MYNNCLKQNNNVKGGRENIPAAQMMPQFFMPPQANGYLPAPPAGGMPPYQAAPRTSLADSIDPAELKRQAEELSRIHPEFQLEKEIENPEFCKYILENKLSVEEAYILIHRSEILGKAKQEALEDFYSKRNRIPENGTGKTAGASVKMNPNDMRDEDIAAIIERVQKGEKISF